eukprot:147352-Amphidinium_carterae.2
MAVLVGQGCLGVRANVNLWQRQSESVDRTSRDSAGQVRPSHAAGAPGAHAGAPPSEALNCVGQ